jgi:molecular chaperone HtpG
MAPKQIFFTKNHYASTLKRHDDSVHFNDLAHILLDQALLAEGGLPADPAAYVKRVNALLV